MNELAITGEWTDERTEFIRKAFCGGAPDAIAMTFIEIAKRRNLSPEERHIYLVNRGGRDKPNWVIQTGIDGYRSMAARSGEYAGSDDAVFYYAHGSLVEDSHGPVSATVTVWRIVKGMRCSFTATARWSEYAATNSPMWQKMPHTMIAKCAEALALRKAFPAELAGIYTSDEMDQAGQPAAPLQGQPLPTHTRAVAEVMIDNETGEILPVQEDDHRGANATYAIQQAGAAKTKVAYNLAWDTAIKDNVDNRPDVIAAFKAAKERLSPKAAPVDAAPLFAPE